jgi:hypothetical protein
VASYEIGSGFTERQLQLASFWARHALLMRRIGFGALIVLCLSLWGYVFWSIVDGYAISYPRESRIMTTLINGPTQLHNQITSLTPSPLQITDVALFPNTDGRMDLFAQITNPNSYWWASFAYRFIIPGQATTTMNYGFVLPGATQDMSSLGFTGPTEGALVQLEEMTWHRVVPASVQNNYPAFAQDRAGFVIDAPTYAPDAVQYGSVRLGQSNFILRNPTAYGYHEVDLHLLLMRQGIPVALQRLRVERLLPGESRSLTVTWPDPDLAADSLEVHPSVNILDPAAYLSSKDL